MTYKKQKVFLKTALAFSELSHCILYKCGAVLVKDGQIISHGVNGTPCGVINCDQLFDVDSFNDSRHTLFSKNWELTAEMNCLMNCLIKGVNCSKSSLYCTMIPRIEEIKYFSMLGIEEIYYIDDSCVSEIDRKYIYDMCDKTKIHIEKFIF